MEDSSTPQPFPDNYRTELLAFMKTYLNNPVGVRNAMMADPVQRTVGGRVRYVACLRFSEPQSDGSYREPRERAVLFINGRLDRVLPNAAEVCAGATYPPVPELENMTRGRGREPRGPRRRNRFNFPLALNPGATLFDK